MGLKITYKTIEYPVTKGTMTACDRGADATRETLISTARAVYGRFSIRLLLIRLLTLYRRKAVGNGYVEYHWPLIRS